MKKFSDPRWNDTTIPEVVGIRELTEEEKEREKAFNEQFEKWLKDRYPKQQAKKKQED
ncbi:hypothetical protein [Enterococcus columbae]|uniref:Uncharacterized protein n=1 Tax=Enterococcus columbae DSM 7374 = ATCC 51263 TaxID=1121865 RepID=S1NFC1_9ENTE|nr:hypothetical protein [Enterococcus columbae]EOT38579.1 hypothetical protein OMW_02219 [Enterococcus columbae DSM 7374 = ATCC 51263]EOW87770.1 hypothetical protein I568_00056 [Enterococcus columbae DSM 7374 = ATCC 51263]